jgi:hypothetical protein
VYRRSLSSGPNTSILAYSSNRGPQGLRRPRFSFFIFTCQTARDPKDPSLHCWRVPEEFTRRRITTDYLPAVESLIVMRSFRGAKRCRWPEGQCIAALSGRVIGPPYRTCQQPSSRNCRAMWKKFSGPRSPYSSGLYAALEPQSCDVLTIRYVSKCRMPVGAAGADLPGRSSFTREWRFSHEPSPYPSRPRNFERSAHH